MQQNSPQQQQQSPPLSTATLQHPGQIRTTQHLTQFLHQNGGSHIPVWVHRDKAHEIISKYAEGGMVIPHPGIPIPMPFTPPGLQVEPAFTGPYPVQPSTGGQPFTHPNPIVPGNTPGPTQDAPPQHFDRGAIGNPVPQGQWPSIGKPSPQRQPLVPPTGMVPQKPDRLSGIKVGGVVKGKDKSKPRGKK